MAETKPEMTTIAGRPTLVQSYLPNANGVYVQCRLANGQDVFIPLNEIFAAGLTFDKPQKEVKHGHPESSST